MKHTKLYPILFEQDNSTTPIIDPKEIAKAVGEEIEPKIKELEDRLEKQSKEVDTKGLSTTGTKPAAGTRESNTDKKIDDIEAKISDLYGMAKEVQRTG